MGLGSPATRLIPAPSSSLGRSPLCPSEPGVLEAAPAHTPGVRGSLIRAHHPRPGGLVPGPAGRCRLKPGAAPSSSLESSLHCPSEPGVLMAASAHTPGVRGSRLWSHHQRPGGLEPGPAGWRHLMPGGPEGARAGRCVKEAESRHPMPGGHGRAHHGRGALRPWSPHSKPGGLGPGRTGAPEHARGPAPLPAAPWHPCTP